MGDVRVGDMSGRATIGPKSNNSKTLPLENASGEIPLRVHKRSEKLFSFHSKRSAVIGSSLEARTAGIQVAAKATTLRRIGTEMKTGGSQLLTP